MTCGFGTGERIETETSPFRSVYSIQERSPAQYPDRFSVFKLLTHIIWTYPAFLIVSCNPSSSLRSEMEKSTDVLSIAFEKEDETFPRMAFMVSGIDRNASEVKR